MRTITCSDDPENPGQSLYQELSTVVGDDGSPYGPTSELLPREEFKAEYLKTHPGDAEILDELMALADEHGSSNPHFDFEDTAGLAF